MAKLGDKKFRYHYKSLSEKEKAGYDTLVSEWLKLNREVKMPLFDSSSIEKIISAIRRDIPELFYVDFRNDFKNFHWITKTNSVTIKSQFLYTNTAINLYKTQLKATIEQFLLDHPFDNLSKFDRELMVHDYLAEGTIYNREYSDDVENATIVAPLIMKCGICEGYAKAFKLLCDRVGVTSMIIFGESTQIQWDSGGPHAWNMIKIDGKCAHVDVTWDSLYPPSSGLRSVSHDYFNVKDSDISKDHKWDKSEYPVCDANDLNYHYRTNSVVKNIKEFDKFVISRLSSKIYNFSLKFDFKVSDYKLIQERIQELAYREHSVFNNVRGLGLMINETLGTALIFFKTSN
jgi:hypothetical protein